VIVVDTTIVSELMRPQPAPVVVDWVRGQGAGELHTTAITLAEVSYGIERAAQGRRRDRLTAAALGIFAGFTEQVLPFDAAAALYYGPIVSHREAAGAPIEGFDAQIASICRAHKATLATRNISDFQDTGVTVVNPWTAHRS